MNQRKTNKYTFKKGLDLPLGSIASNNEKISSALNTGSVGLLGADYPGLKPRLLVEAGQQVKLGEPLFVDKREPTVKFVAPGTGTISAINRGERRALVSITIELTEARPSCDWPITGNVKEILQSSGLWTAFRTRPFGIVPPSNSEPVAIYVTALDTRPLSLNPVTVINNQEALFYEGLKQLQETFTCPIRLCTAPDWAARLPPSVEHHIFSGPHPSGLASTHIHTIDPVGLNKIAWHIDYQDVIAIGKLFLEETLDMTRHLSLAGPAVANPEHLISRVGTNLNFFQAALKPGHVRLISGCVLAGREVKGDVHFLGRFHQQVSAVFEANAIVQPGFTAYLPRWLQRWAQSMPDTRRHGRHTAMLPVEKLDNVMPMDIFMVPLIRAMLMGDVDQVQRLGGLELLPEDLALCSFVCPGKHRYGEVLQANLNVIEKES
jgi:Na+-transporting NADH:ubiquinone oxidoreductase subunit A